ncbi:hypothetical protein AMAG_10053 [Allomyces macrogynus ATCC 38327]|uniref:GATA-type domain-containing protein n=1 Tax=Allomyces macrogynus (strain ATCC 38327) TaxID=578462 RepID=A0A0L0SQB9_ALLM3|nr:hypothetical protein AMAG_10053 [Allomyces macrogynus ATCC 38327]|eukprot:KNE64702.1 hypothetical protein AMAG_10053 [Allomyces macrogynus ATCC 38327]
MLDPPTSHASSSPSPGPPAPPMPTRVAPPPTRVALPSARVAPPPARVAPPPIRAGPPARAQPPQRRTLPTAGRRPRSPSRSPSPPGSPPPRSDLPLSDVSLYDRNLLIALVVAIFCDQVTHPDFGIYRQSFTFPLRAHDVTIIRKNLVRALGAALDRDVRGYSVIKAPESETRPPYDESPPKFARPLRNLLGELLIDESIKGYSARYNASKQTREKPHLNGILHQRLHQYLTRRPDVITQPHGFTFQLPLNPTVEYLADNIPCIFMRDTETDEANHRTRHVLRWVDLRADASAAVHFLCPNIGDDLGMLQNFPAPRRRPAGRAPPNPVAWPTDLYAALDGPMGTNVNDPMDVLSKLSSVDGNICIILFVAAYCNQARYPDRALYRTTYAFPLSEADLTALTEILSDLIAAGVGLSRQPRSFRIPRRETSFASQFATNSAPSVERFTRTSLGDCQIAAQPPDTEYDEVKRVRPTAQCDLHRNEFVLASIRAYLTDWLPHLMALDGLPIGSKGKRNKCPIPTIPCLFEEVADGADGRKRMQWAKPNDRRTKAAEYLYPKINDELASLDPGPAATGAAGDEVEFDITRMTAREGNLAIAVFTAISVDRVQHPDRSIYQRSFPTPLSDAQLTELVDHLALVLGLGRGVNRRIKAFPGGKGTDNVPLVAGYNHRASFRNVRRCLVELYDTRPNPRHGIASLTPQQHPAVQRLLREYLTAWCRAATETRGFPLQKRFLWTDVIPTVFTVDEDEDEEEGEEGGATGVLRWADLNSDTAMLFYTKLQDELEDVKPAVGEDEDEEEEEEEEEEMDELDDDDDDDQSESDLDEAPTPPRLRRKLRSARAGGRKETDVGGEDDVSDLDEAPTHKAQQFRARAGSRQDYRDRAEEDHCDDARDYRAEQDHRGDNPRRDDGDHRGDNHRCDVRDHRAKQDHRAEHDHGAEDTRARRRPSRRGAERRDVSDNEEDMRRAEPEDHDLDDRRARRRRSRRLSEFDGSADRRSSSVPRLVAKAKITVQDTTESLAQQHQDRLLDLVQRLAGLFETQLFNLPANRKRIGKWRAAWESHLKDSIRAHGHAADADALVLDPRTNLHDLAQYLASFLVAKHTSEFYARAGTITDESATAICHAVHDVVQVLASMAARPPRDGVVYLSDLYDNSAPWAQAMHVALNETWDLCRALGMHRAPTTPIEFVRGAVLDVVASIAMLARAGLCAVFPPFSAEFDAATMNLPRVVAAAAEDTDTVLRERRVVCSLAPSITRAEDGRVVIPGAEHAEVWCWRATAGVGEDSCEWAANVAESDGWGIPAADMDLVAGSDWEMDEGVMADDGDDDDAGVDEDEWGGGEDARMDVDDEDLDARDAPVPLSSGSRSEELTPRRVRRDARDYDDEEEETDAEEECERTSHDTPSRRRYRSHSSSSSVSNPDSESDSASDYQASRRQTRGTSSSVPPRAPIGRRTGKRESDKPCAHCGVTKTWRWHNTKKWGLLCGACRQRQWRQDKRAKDMRERSSGMAGSDARGPRTERDASGNDNDDDEPRKSCTRCHAITTSRWCNTAHWGLLCQACRSKIDRESGKRPPRARSSRRASDDDDDDDNDDDDSAWQPPTAKRRRVQSRPTPPPPPPQPASADDGHVCAQCGATEASQWRHDRPYANPNARRICKKCWHKRQRLQKQERDEDTESEADAESASASEPAPPAPKRQPVRGNGARPPPPMRSWPDRECAECGVSDSRGWHRDGARRQVCDECWSQLLEARNDAPPRLSPSPPMPPQRQEPQRRSPTSPLSDAPMSPRPAAPRRASRSPPLPPPPPQSRPKDRQCMECNTTGTKSWRRDSSNRLVCERCWERLRQQLQQPQDAPSASSVPTRAPAAQSRTPSAPNMSRLTPAMLSSLASSPPATEVAPATPRRESEKRCVECDTTKSSEWRRNSEGQRVCSAAVASTGCAS